MPESCATGSAQWCMSSQRTASPEEARPIAHPCGAEAVCGHAGTSMLTGLTTSWASSGSGRSLGRAVQACWATSGLLTLSPGMSWRAMASGILTGKLCWQSQRESLTGCHCSLACGVLRPAVSRMAIHARGVVNRRILTCLSCRFLSPLHRSTSLCSAPGRLTASAGCATPTSLPPSWRTPLGNWRLRLLPSTSVEYEKGRYRLKDEYTT